MIKKFIFSLFFIFISLNLFAQDKWDGRDKILHFKYSYGLHLLSNSYLYYTTDNSNLTNQLLASTFVFGLGLGKEMYDEIYGTGFSYKDLTYDIAGILCGVFISSFLYTNPMVFVSITRRRYYIFCTFGF